MPYRTDHLPALPCYLNGEITTLDQARISPLDRGFIFGDGVYEGIAFYSRPGEAARPFRFEQHMARLERSLKETQIANPHTRAEWKQIALDLIAVHPEAGANGPLGLVLLLPGDTRRGPARPPHAAGPHTHRVAATCLPLKPPTAEQRAQGVACVTADDFRWKKAHIKSISLLGAVFARQLSYEQGALETVMFRDGFLSEAAASNVWVVKDGKVMGPPKDNLVLEGIRYGAIEEICRAAGIGFVAARLPKAEVLAADELLLSSATRRCCPSPALDGQPVGTGKPGPVYARLYAAYRKPRRPPHDHPADPPKDDEGVALPDPQHPDPSPSDPRREALIEYPSKFPIKVLGARQDGFVHAVTQVAEQFDPTFGLSTVELRESGKGNYLGVTITVTATSREQLDNLYRALTSHPMVKVVCKQKRPEGQSWQAQAAIESAAIRSGVGGQHRLHTAGRHRKSSTAAPRPVPARPRRPAPRAVWPPPPARPARRGSRRCRC